MWCCVCFPFFILRTSFTSMSACARTYRGKFMYGNILASKIICQPLYRHALKSLLSFPNFFSKNWFYFSFLVFWHHQPHHLVGCHATGINSLLLSFLNALHFSNLCQAESQTWIIVAGSSSLKSTSSRLILSRSTLRIPIYTTKKWLYQNLHKSIILANKVS